MPDIKIDEHTEVRANEDGSIDEIVAHNADVHWEYLSDQTAMLRIGPLLLTVWTTKCKLRLCGNSERGTPWEGGEFSR